MASNNNRSNSGNKQSSNQGGNKQSGSQSGSKQSGDTSNRGFASMDPNKQREIASEGGRAAHAAGTAHEFTSQEAREAGRMSHKNDGNQQSGSGSGSRSGGNSASGSNSASGNRSGGSQGGNNGGGRGSKR
jgi:hypothetical protein